MVSFTFTKNRAWKRVSRCPVNHGSYHHTKTVVDLRKYQQKNAENVGFLEDVSKIFLGITGWWFQPIWKYYRSQIGNLPQIGVKIKNVWNHHLDNFDASILSLSVLWTIQSLQSYLSPWFLENEAPYPILLDQGRDLLEKNLSKCWLGSLESWMLFVEPKSHMQKGHIGRLRNLQKVCNRLAWLIIYGCH